MESQTKVAVSAVNGESLSRAKFSGLMVGPTKYGQNLALHTNATNYIQMSGQIEFTV